MRRASLALTAVLMVSGLASAAQAAPSLHLGPMRIVRGLHLPAGQTQSTNWSGYATTGTTFKVVSGTWKQPAVNCAVAPNGLAAYWVGIDGYTSQTVEQDGTIAVCTNGSPTYYDWWEMYPSNAVQIVHSVSPGDSFAASVTYMGGSSYKLTVTDMTHSGDSFTVTESNTCGSSCARTSAEWIAEAPCCVGNNVYPMPDWGKIKFAKSSTTDDAGHTGTISDGAWSNDEITMVNNSSQVKAKPSSLKKGGATFNVKWVRAQ